MKEIKLSKGFIALVDDEDFEWLNQWKWSYHSGGYAVRMHLGHKMLFMHRFIMNVPTTLEIDHINHNGIDNRKCNLRICTTSQNLHNTKIQRNNTSGYKGVSFNKLTNKWEAYIKINNKKIHLGLFNTSEDAARAYDAKTKNSFGKFALTNFKENI